MLTDFNNIW